MTILVSLLLFTTLVAVIMSFRTTSQIERMWLDYPRLECSLERTAFEAGIYGKGTPELLKLKRRRLYLFLFVSGTYLLGVVLCAFAFAGQLSDNVFTVFGLVVLNVLYIALNLRVAMHNERGTSHAWHLRD